MDANVRKRRKPISWHIALAWAFLLPAAHAFAGAPNPVAPSASEPIPASSTGFVYGDIFLRHDTGPDHPERPARLRAIVDALEKDWPDGLVRLSPAPAEIAHLTRVHPLRYVQRVENACREGATRLDALDTPISRDSYAAALHATGGVLKAVDAVLEGRIRNAFCAVRPPGHHATADRAMGFCLFNHVAVAAAYLRDVHGLERVAIVDWDVHHGNGTQDIFYDCPRVFYMSLHQHPLYPGTGTAEETGAGEGEGTTLNLPLPEGAGDDAFLALFRERVIPALETFAPDFILISAGFDAHEADPLGGTNVTGEGFARMTRKIKHAADTLCDGRIVSVLEGGYNLSALADAVRTHIEVLLEPAVVEAPRVREQSRSKGM